MLDQLGREASGRCVQRIYAVGLSEGGFMSMRLGCAMSDRIAAIAAVGAAMPKTMICLPTRPVPLMRSSMAHPIRSFLVRRGHRHKPNLATIFGGRDSAKSWARIDRCEEKPERSKLMASAKGGTETKSTPTTGATNAQVVLYSLKGAGNTWPGGEQYEAGKPLGRRVPIRMQMK